MEVSTIRLISAFVIAAGLAGCGGGNGRQEGGANENRTQVAANMQPVTSKDGTRIAFDREGSGPPLIIVGGALSDRAGSAALAKLLAPHFTVYSFDRRGRGESGDTRPYAAAREIEDIEALIDHAGGSAFVAGFSSGAALSLQAAAALGGKVRKLALYEAPYDEAKGAAGKWQIYRKEQEQLLATGRMGDAVVHHLKFVGLPDAAIQEMKGSPAWAGMVRMAGTLPYDVAVIGDDRSVPVARAATIGAETLVMDGAASRQAMPFMAATAERIATAIPQAERRTIEGQGHNAAPDVLAPVLIEWFKDKPR